VVEAVVIPLAGQAPFDAELAERAVRGVLGLPPTTARTDPRNAGGSSAPTTTDMEAGE
jgi:hypothetical protein